jgi:hypothetical protein
VIRVIIRRQKNTLRKLKSEQFEGLEQIVNSFNENLTTKDAEITEIVSKHLKDKGFEISDNPSETPKENIVLINYLIPALKLFWRSKMFDYIQEQILDEEIGSKKLMIKGSFIIIVSNKDKEKEIRECIECALLHDYFKSFFVDVLLL